ncbi:hypothetical protein SUDANB174_06166 [Streptomyces sp. enrichment culture]
MAKVAPTPDAPAARAAQPASTRTRTPRLRVPERAFAARRTARNAAPAEASRVMEMPVASATGPKTWSTSWATWPLSLNCSSSARPPSTAGPTAASVPTRATTTASPVIIHLICAGVAPTLCSRPISASRRRTFTVRVEATAKNTSRVP